MFTYSTNLTTQTKPEAIRLLQQGAPGTGKTWSVVRTFPKVKIADFDNKLNAHSGLDAEVLKFWDEKFILQLADILKMPDLKTKKRPEHQINRRDAFKYWLILEAPKIPKGETLLLDSWTRLQDAFDIQTGYEPAFTKGGALDEFAFWQTKLEYATEICSALTSLQCHVVVNVHEQQQRNDKGEMITKLEPLMQGKFVAKMAGYFSDHFRLLVETVKGTDGKPLLKDGIPQVKRLWQTKSDGGVNLSCSMPNAPMYVEPAFESFKY